MVFNYTNKNKFSTRLTFEGEILETVSDTKLLGTIVSNDLKWNRNIENMLKKSKQKNGTVEENFII